jgi:hypothetical protein
MQLHTVQGKVVSHDFVVASLLHGCDYSQSLQTSKCTEAALSLTVLHPQGKFGSTTNAHDVAGRLRLRQVLQLMQHDSSLGCCWGSPLWFPTVSGRW